MCVNGTNVMMDTVCGTLANVLTLGIYEPEKLMQPDPYHKSTPRSMGLVYDNVHCFFDTRTGRTISQSSSEPYHEAPIFEPHQDDIEEPKENSGSPEVRVLHGWYIYPPHVRQRPHPTLECDGPFVNSHTNFPVVVVCADLVGNMSSNLNALKFINTVFKDHAVLFFDYVGYGLSMSETCHPSTDMCYRSAWQAVKYLLVEKRLEREQLVIWGVGYGCTIASYLCSKLNSQCQALVLERPCPTRFATHVRGAWSKHLHNPVRLGAGVFGMAHELDMDRHLAEIHGHGQSYVKVLCLMTSKDEKQYFKGIHGHCPWAKCIIMDKYDRGSLFLIQAQLEQLLRVA